MPSKIMLIRHAEKPHGKHEGVTDTGEPDPESLTVKGWQRAGALVALFDPAEGALQNANLAVPTVIYASKPVTSSGDEAGKKIGSKSERPLETITPLAKRLNLSPDLSFVAGQEHDLAKAVLGASGIVLICWQHEKIADITNHIVGANPPTPPYPASWPDDRFDIVWVLSPPSAPKQPWGFVQVPQQLLAGDSDTVIT